MLFFIVFTLFGVILLALFLWNKSVTPSVFELRGSHVLVTGGSSGIGKEVAIEAVKRGANVTLLARNEVKLREAKEVIETFIQDATKQKVFFVSVDVSKEYEPVEMAIQKAVAELGPVDMLVNSAGISHPGEFDVLTVDQFRNMMDVNYFGSIFATRAVIPEMKKRQLGRVVFLSSQAGQVGLFGFTGYSATKFALRGLAEALQMEVKPYNIHICIAFPPDTDTPGLHEENKTKPMETKLICETSGVFEANHVARIILNDAVKGSFQSFLGIDGWLLSSLASGMSPVTSVLDAMFQVLTMGLFRAVSLVYLAHFDRVVARCYRDKRRQT